MRRYTSSKMQKFSKLLEKRGFSTSQEETASSILIEQPGQHFTHEDIIFLLESAIQCRVRLKGFGKFRAYRGRSVRSSKV